MKVFVLFLAALLALPLIGAAPATCADPCSIVATSEGYRLPANTVASGSTLLFTSGDIGHVTTDGLPLGAQTPCFALSQIPSTPATPLTLTIVGGVLVASYADGNGPHTATCSNAVALPDGSFALPFYCKIHSTMRGFLVITSASEQALH